MGQGSEVGTGEQVDHAEEGRAALWGQGAWVPTQTSLASGYPSEPAPALGSEPLPEPGWTWPARWVGEMRAGKPESFTSPSL